MSSEINAAMNEIEIEELKASVLVLSVRIEELEADKAKLIALMNQIMVHLKHDGLEWMHEIITVSETASQGGIHRDRDAAGLQAVNSLMKLIHHIHNDIQRLVDRSRGIEPLAWRDLDDIPF